jgi:ribosomal protein S6
MDNEILKENYEIAFWTKDENEGSAKKVIAKHGGEIVKEKPVQKMRLAYPIKKENFAFFGNLIFQMLPGEVLGLKTDLNLEGGVLRYFFRRAKKNVSDESSAGSSFRERTKSFLGFRTDAKRGAEQTLTNEALEKKIEEILQ